MAEEDAREESITLAGVLWETAKISAEAVASPIQAILGDSFIQAAGRQGIDEIGMALKAFPDSIQAYEMGTIFSPTPYEVSKDRNVEMPSLGEMVQEAQPYSPEQDLGIEQERSHGRGR
ncbi:hypothetical protein ACYOEI_21950 [Singulisphaera rosea]